MANETKFRLSVQTHQGMVRKNNEDAFAVSRPGEGQGFLMSDEDSIEISDINHPDAAFDRVVITVADGMGGTNAGEIAAKIAVETINETILSAGPATPVKSLLIDAINQANVNIIEYSRLHPQSAGMGTTCVIAAVEGYQIHIAWIGDSRAYLFNPEAGLVQLSKDHSLVQELIDMRQLTMEEAFYHPDSNIITQSLGEPDRTIDPGFLTADFQDEDVLVLCSDGLNSMLQDTEIYEIIRASYHLSASEIAAKLIESANEEGGQDNTTVAVYQRERKLSASGETDQSVVTANRLSLPSAISEKVVPTQPRQSWFPRRYRRPVLVLALALLAGGVWWQNHLADERKAAEDQKKRDLFVADSLQNVQDSISRLIAIQDSISASLRADSIEQLLLVKITENTTDSLSAINLSSKLKDVGFEVVCKCDESPYRVFVRIDSTLTQTEGLKSLRSVFNAKHKDILKKYQLNPEEFDFEKK